MPQWKVPGYTELKPLGSGGFGEVILARHDESGTLVAIKHLHGDLLADTEFADLFRAEATTLGAIDDPNVVRLYEYVESSAGAAIVMELVGGVSLREILRYQGKTTPEAALAVLRGSLLGLAAAHRRGVVHRDYKPENVLVNGDGVSKLTDFGIAARAGACPIPAGTLMYAAPEQMAGAAATPASDVYSATATFYECLTGRPPFSGETEELLARHRVEPVPLDQVPEPLRALVTAGMAKDPLGRPTDATSFVAELDAAASSACGKHWADRGRSHLSEAALLLAALWPSGAPPTVQGSAAHWILFGRRGRTPSPAHRPLRLWRTGLGQVGVVKAVIAAMVVVAVAAAGTALALTGSQQPASSHHLAAPGMPPSSLPPASLSLSPSPSLTSSAASHHATRSASASPTGPATIPAVAPPPASTPPSPSRLSPPRKSGPPSGGGGSPSPQSPSLSPTPPAPQLPQIISVSTHTQGQLVYFDIEYADPGHDAEGFGFVGVNGSGWAEENHPFSSPSYGIVGPNSISYPFNEECGTPSQYDSSVQAWIYDTTGHRSTTVTIHLVCS
jgi:eukaryotic-like serine/threonine-protein kinase